MSPPASPPVALDPLSLAKNSSGIVFVVLLLLVVAAVLVWFIAILKLLQLRRWRKAQDRFEEQAAGADGAEILFELARRHGDAPGARVVRALERRRGVPAALEGVAKRAIVDEQQRASSLMPMLASIGSAAPFVGLFGTVWGIMDAFLKIGREKSASLPVVAPSIGEALIATAVGLFAAIPAVVAYNAISKRVDDLLQAVEAAAIGWVAIIGPEVASAPAPAAAPMAFGQQGPWPPPGYTPSPTPQPPGPRFPHPSHTESHPLPLDRPAGRSGRPPPFPGAR